MTDIYVKIIELGTDKVVRTIGPLSQSAADRVERGVLINLNHDKFYTLQSAAK